MSLRGVLAPKEGEAYRALSSCVKLLPHYGFLGERRALISLARMLNRAMGEPYHAVSLTPNQHNRYVLLRALTAWRAFAIWASTDA